MNRSLLEQKIIFIKFLQDTKYVDVVYKIQNEIVTHITKNYVR